MKYPTVMAVVAAVLLSAPAVANECKSPNVARVVIGIDPRPLFTADNLSLHIAPCDLVCPVTGPCTYRCALQEPPQRIICLTATENAAAMSAWHQ